jgi:hypothetical protein
MQDYRAYILGPDGHVHDRVDLPCDDDGEAMKLAKRLVDGRDVGAASLECRQIEAQRMAHKNQPGCKGPWRPR